ncbi:hypothetical protein [Bacillus sp. AFS073361]|nr:hypothetical protein [Bacillus sp. AFS073361]
MNVIYRRVFGKVTDGRRSSSGPNNRRIVQEQSSWLRKQFVEAIDA